MTYAVFNITPWVGEAVIMASQFSAWGHNRGFWLLRAFRIQLGQKIFAIALHVYLFNFIRKIVMLTNNMQPLYITHFKWQSGNTLGIQISKG